MLLSQLSSSQGYPHVQRFIEQVLDMQFGDVRAMLQLPRPDIGITPGCNFAIVSTLCNLVSGISTTIYKPISLLSEVQSECGSGRAFRELVQDFFPYTPAGTPDFPRDLYELFRNPLAHSAGVRDASTPVVYLTRVFDPAHQNSGWSSQELDDIERPDRPYSFPHRGIVIESRGWTLHCESFYTDVIELFRRLTSDSAQMQAAEARFNHGVYNWRPN